MRKQRKVFAVLGLLSLAVLLSGVSCDKAKKASVAVNRYKDQLKTVVNVTKSQHDAGKIPDADYGAILNYEDAANDAGQNLNSAIRVAVTGGDTTKYIAAAQKTFDDLAASVHSGDSVKKQEVIAVVDIAAGLLKDAVVLIQQIKAQNAPSPAPVKSGIFLLFGLMGLAAATGDSDTLLKILKILGAITSLESPALALILSFATSLKGKTTEEVLAMNDEGFNEIRATIAAERAKLGGTKV